MVVLKKFLCVTSVVFMGMVASANEASNVSQTFKRQRPLSVQTIRRLNIAANFGMSSENTAHHTSGNAARFAVKGAPFEEIEISIDGSASVIAKADDGINKPALKVANFNSQKTIRLNGFGKGEFGVGATLQATDWRSAVPGEYSGKHVVSVRRIKDGTSITSAFNIDAYLMSDLAMAQMRALEFPELEIPSGGVSILPSGELSGYFDVDGSPGAEIVVNFDQDTALLTGIGDDKTIEVANFVAVASGGGKLDAEGFGHVRMGARIEGISSEMPENCYYGTTRIQVAYPAPSKAWSSSIVDMSLCLEK